MAAVSISPKIPVSPENIKIAQYFIIGVVVWLVLTGQVRKYKQANAYAQAGTNPNTAFAIEVRQSCNPSGMKWLIDMDGTWENDLMLVADQISNLNAVNAQYVALYNENMFERLEKELNATRFQEWMRRAQSAPTTTQVPGASVGGKLAALNDTIVFHATDSTKIAKRVKAGELIGEKIGAYTIKVSGVSKKYWLVQWTSFIFLVNQGLVLASDTKEV
jgi:hypothetical protein